MWPSDRDFHIVSIFAHHDDVVLSAFTALSAPRACVLDVVVCSGKAADDHAGPWDRSAGFESASQALRWRRREHRHACHDFVQRHIELDALDQQHGGISTRDHERLVSVLLVEFDRFAPDIVITHQPDAVHQDHRQTSSLATRVALAFERPVVFVCDRPYFSCGTTCQWRDRMREVGRTSHRMALDVATWNAKREAVSKYRSQHKPLQQAFGGGWAQRDLLGWECYHTLEATSP